MKRTAFILAAFLTSGLIAAEVSTNVTASGETTATLMGKKVTLTKEGGDFAADFGQAGRKANEARRAQLPYQHKGSDVFLHMKDQEVTWDKMDAYVALVLKISPLQLPPEATAEQVEQILATSRLKIAERAGNQYIQNWLMVDKAKAAGIVVSETEVLKAVSNSVRKVSRRFKNEVLAQSLDPEGYLYRNQVGYLYTKRYFEEVVSKQIEVSDEEIAAEQQKRRDEIEKAKEYNATLRPKIEKILADIKSGTNTFEDAALEYSDCGSSTEDGVFGEFDIANCTLLAPLKEAVFAASTNELSDVIETPYSYHIIKFLERKYERTAEEAEEIEEEEDVEADDGAEPEVKK